ncbi:MAG: histidine phosphatase family protein [Acidimicrobiales bacterium]
MNTDGHTYLLLVRHGQSTWNVEQRWQGQADPPLSELGRRQAGEAAAAIGAVDAIVASPLIRAAETAAIISSVIGVGPVQLDEGMLERDAGAWSGLTTAEIEATHPGWIVDGRRPEGWEHDHDLLPRVLDAIGRIVVELAGATVLVVCHGGVIATLEQHLGVADGRVPNLAGRIILARPGGIDAGDRLELLPPELVTGGTGRARV